MHIPGINQQAFNEALARQQRLTLTPGALGQLETIACWFAARQGKPVPDMLKAHVVVFAADHGVAKEGVSAFPASATAMMVRDRAAGGAAINVLARHCGAMLDIVDVGVDADMEGVAGVEHAKVRRGSGNIAIEGAMKQSEYWEAVGIGEDMAARAITAGANLLVAGDVGVGSTTAAAALICELAGLETEEVVGRGSGIDDEAYVRKLAIVEQARARAEGTPSTDVLREFGGLEIAAMAGFYRAAAERGVPVLLDGFVSAAAALAAVAWDVRISGWLLASHVTEEAGHARALAELSLEPLIDFNLRTGDGCGATLVVPLLNAALALHRDMATCSLSGAIAPQC